MKYPTLLALALLMSAPIIASAHQHATITIGGTDYDFVIGSLNEPVAVDDKTGVELQVSMAGHEHMAADDHHAEGGAVTGLENSLQVELIAGDRKKVLDLSPKYNTPGSYTAPFYPTEAVPLSYRFFGTINNTPVDLTFACREEGALDVEEGEKNISAGVKQISKSGGFGCPTERVGFPAEADSSKELSDAAGGARSMGVAGLALGAIALAFAAARRRSN